MSNPHFGRRKTEKPPNASNGTSNGARSVGLLESDDARTAKNLHRPQAPPLLHRPNFFRRLLIYTAQRHGYSRLTSAAGAAGRQCGRPGRGSATVPRPVSVQGLEKPAGDGQGQTSCSDHVHSRITHFLYVSHWLNTEILLTLSQLISDCMASMRNNTPSFVNLHA